VKAARPTPGDSFRRAVRRREGNPIGPGFWAGDEERLVRLPNSGERRPWDRGM